ncbi:MAG: hypothetical protein JXA06_02900 [Bacteroidetes bacterium]|nr:hypothetical protein [Bacteroidota bacterium]
MNGFKGNILQFSAQNIKHNNPTAAGETEVDSRPRNIELPENNGGKKESNIFRLECRPANPVCHEKCRVQLIEYDFRMRRETQKYSKLISELNSTYWFNRHVAKHGGFDWSGKSDVKPSTEPDETRLTEEEILYGDDITLDQVILRKQMA